MSPGTRPTKSAAGTLLSAAAAATNWARSALVIVRFSVPPAAGGDVDCETAIVDVVDSDTAGVEGPRVVVVLELADDPHPATRTKGGRTRRASRVDRMSASLAQWTIQLTPLRTRLTQMAQAQITWTGGYGRVPV